MIKLPWWTRNELLSKQLDAARCLMDDRIVDAYNLVREVHTILQYYHYAGGKQDGLKECLPKGYRKQCLPLQLRK